MRDETPPCIEDDQMMGVDPGLRYLTGFLTASGLTMQPRATMGPLESVSLKDKIRCQ